jgi:hypothetical protein
LSGLPFHALPVQADKIDWVQHQRWEAAVLHSGGDDLAREGEQQARTLDHNQRV